MDLTTLAVVVIGVLLTAFLAVFGWHLNATINLMGAFRDVINELKALNAMIGQRDEHQKLTNSKVLPAGKWFAGKNSVNVSGNVNWLFRRYIMMPIITIIRKL